MTLNFSDQVIFDSNNIPRRDTSVSLSGSFSQSWGRWLYGFFLGGGYVRNARENGEASAYRWRETGSEFFYFTGFSFSNIRRRPHELFGTGMALNLRWASLIRSPLRENFEPRFEAMLRANAETRFPLSLTLYGTYDARGMNLRGVSNTFGQPLFAAVSSIEYPHPTGLTLTWLGGAELAMGLFSFEIQNNITHAYFNRVFSSLALRSVIYDSQGHLAAEGIHVNNDLRLAQSLVLRLGLTTTFIPLKLAPIAIEPNMWGAWRFSNAITGQGQQWNFGMGVNVTF
jgi:hypothetical protein